MRESERDREREIEGDNITSSGFKPQITLPTHLSDTSDMLIEYIHQKNHENFILTRTISEHQMTCCILTNHNVINAVNTILR